MKRWIAVLMMVAAMTVTSFAEEEPNAPEIEWTIGIMAGDNVAEFRLGAIWDAFEAYIAPRYDKALASEGDVATDLRVYGMYNALTADVIANWINGDWTLPEGVVYAGLYGGWEFQDGQLEAGWLVGSKTTLNDAPRHWFDWATEYQQAWQTFREDHDRYVVVTGPCIRFKPKASR